ncbi:MAG TPA: hypothetical protein DDY71_16650 [Spirochaetia bacterium]|nr:MAG: hypothetical protein A2Y29_03505 [Spirochaetes bacterium GWE2_31_10]HBD94611.1 hypothetical protein [Spirochaetia bacterium]HBI39273.1 hypothetical protein [Spirochaetia bacterium]
MIYHVKNLVRYIILLISIFLFFIINLMLINILPASLGGMLINETAQIAKSFLVPVFYYSLYNSMILSIFLYGFLLIDFDHVHKTSVRVLGLSITIIMVFFVVVILNPHRNDITIKSIQDGRLYLVNGVFFNYINEIPSVIDEESYETIISKLSKNEKSVITLHYLKNNYNNSYILNDKTDYVTLTKIRSILLSSGYLDDIKIYFKTVKKNSVGGVIISFNDSVLNFQELPFNFINDKLYLVIPDEKNTTLVFYKKNLLLNDISSLSLIYNLIESNKKIISIFFSHSRVNKILIWSVFAYILVTISSLIYNRNFPLLSIVFNILLLFFIYYFSDDIFTIIQLFYEYVVPEKVYKFRQIITVFFLFIPAFIFNLVRLLLLSSKGRRENV